MQHIQNLNSKVAQLDSLWFTHSWGQEAKAHKRCLKEWINSTCPHSWQCRNQKLWLNMHSDPSRMLTTQGNATNWSHPLDCKLHLISRLHHTSWYFHKTRKTTEQLQSAKCNPLRGKRCEISHLRNIWAAPASPTVETGHFFGVLPMICSSTFGSMKVSYGSHTHHQEKNKAQLAAFVVHLKNPKSLLVKTKEAALKWLKYTTTSSKNRKTSRSASPPSPCHCLMLNETQGVIRLDLEGYQDSRSLSPLKVGI